MPAAAADRVATEEAAFRLIVLRTDAGPARAGVEVRLKPGWKLYWRSPGPYGIAPSFDASGSENAVNFRVRWPAPSRIGLGTVGRLSLAVIGYRGAVVFPAEFDIARPDRPATLKLDMRYGVCLDFCIPGKVTLDRTVRPSDGVAPADAELMKRAFARVPRTAAEVGLRLTAARLGGNGRVVAVRLESATPFRQPDVFVETAARHLFDAPAITLAGDRRSATVRIALEEGETRQLIVGTTLIVTLVDGAIAAEVVAALVP